MASIPSADQPRLEGPIIGEPVIDDVKAWLRLPSADQLDDVALQAGLDAAIEYHRRHCHFPFDSQTGAPVYTPDLVLAAYLRCARYLARRASPDMLSSAGGEFGVVRIGSIDRDIAQLEGTYTPMVFA